MQLCQTPKISDNCPRAPLSAANDNYKRTNNTMKDVEVGSILTQRDYTEPSKREQIGLIAAGAICFVVLAGLISRLPI
jgi:hypothetical protein